MLFRHSMRIAQPLTDTHLQYTMHKTMSDFCPKFAMMRHLQAKKAQIYLLFEKTNTLIQTYRQTDKKEKQTDRIKQNVCIIVQSIGAKNMSIVHFVIKAPKLVQMIVSISIVQG